MSKRNVLKTMKSIVISTLVPVFLFSMVQATAFAAETGSVTTTGITGTVTHTTPGKLVTGVCEVNTLKFINVVSKTGKITVSFTDGDLRGTSIIPVVAGETAAQVAAKLPKYYNNYIVAPYYTVTAVGSNVVFTSVTATKDKAFKVTVVDASSTGVGALSSTETTAGVVAVSTKQVDTLTVATTGTAAGNILVTFNDGTSTAKTVGVTTGDTATQVAAKISAAFSGLTGYAVTSSGPNVIFTAAVAAANKNVAITVVDK